MSYNYKEVVVLIWDFFLLNRDLHTILVFIRYYVCLRFNKRYKFLFLSQQQGCWGDLVILNLKNLNCRQGL